MRSNARRFLNTEGVVVRTRNLGEADRIVILLTADHGLVSCVARGARKPKSRVGGQTDLLRHISAALVAGRSELLVISQVETIDAHLGLQTDLDRLTLGSHMAESSEQFSTEGAENRDLFHLLRDSLGYAESADVATLRMLRLWHDVQMLTVSGWEPELFRCVRTGVELTEGDHWWSALEGGVVAGGYSAELARRRSDGSITATLLEDDPALRASLVAAPVDALKLLRYVVRVGGDWERLSGLGSRAALVQVDTAQGLVSRLMQAVTDRGGRETRSARVGREV